MYHLQYVFQQLYLHLKFVNPDLALVWDHFLLSTVEVISIPLRINNNTTTERSNSAEKLMTPRTQNDILLGTIVVQIL